MNSRKNEAVLVPVIVVVFRNGNRLYELDIKAVVSWQLVPPITDHNGDNLVSQALFPSVEICLVQKSTQMVG